MTTKQAIVNAIGSVREDIAGGLSADDRKTYDSTFNIMWNAVLFVGVYTPLFPPERVLRHNLYLIFPLVDMDSFFFPEIKHPFAIAAAVARNYVSHIDSI